MNAVKRQPALTERQARPLPANPASQQALRPQAMSDSYAIEAKQRDAEGEECHVISDMSAVKLVHKFHGLDHKFGGVTEFFTP